MPKTRLAIATVGLLTALGCRCALASDRIDRNDMLQAPAKLYVGYYAEDPADNPEDPTVGAMILRLPAHDDSFSGLMSFSFLGCKPGVDVGTVSGTRTPTRLNGKWAGTVDGVAVGGAFTGDYSAAEDSFKGRFDNAAGKKRVAAAEDCSYYVAGTGRYVLFGSMSKQPAAFVATATAGREPKLSWTPLGRDIYYRVQVFDEDCLMRGAADASCFEGEALTEATSVRYPADFPLAQAPQLRATSLALVTALDSEGRFAGLAALRMIPGERR